MSRCPTPKSASTRRERRTAQSCSAYGFFGSCFGFTTPEGGIGVLCHDPSYRLHLSALAVLHGSHTLTVATWIAPGLAPGAALGAGAGAGCAERVIIEPGRCAKCRMGMLLSSPGSRATIGYIAGQRYGWRWMGDLGDE